MRNQAPLQELEIVIPFLPPSSNHIYFNRRGGGRALTKEAVAFQNRFGSQVLPNYLPLISRFDTSGIFTMHLLLFFPTDELINSTYGSGKKGAAKTRYKKMDIDNRSKLIVDCVVKALKGGDFDDSLFFREIKDKYDCRLVGGQPQSRIRLTKTDPSVFGL